MASALRYLVLAMVFAWFMIGGTGHFTHTALFLSAMPPYLPWHLAAVYVSGVFEIVGALGLLHPRTRPWACYGLIILTMAVTPVNVYMWQYPERFPKIPPDLLSARLVLQVLLILAIYWCSCVRSE